MTPLEGADTLNMRGRHTRVATMNVMGNFLDALPSLANNSNDVLMLTETKLTSDKHKRWNRTIRKSTPAYHTYTSCSPHRTGERGVALLIHRKLAHPVRHHDPPTSNIPPGCMIHVTIMPRHTAHPTHLIALYIPLDDNDARTRIYAYVRRY